jgi:hypothetical protein
MFRLKAVRAVEDQLERSESQWWAVPTLRPVLVFETLMIKEVRTVEDQLGKSESQWWAVPTLQLRNRNRCWHRVPDSDGDFDRDSVERGKIALAPDSLRK